MSYRKVPEITDEARERIVDGLREKRRRVRLAQLDLNTALAEAQARGLTLRDLELALGVSSSTLSRWSKDVA